MVGVCICVCVCGGEGGGLLTVPTITIPPCHALITLTYMQLAPLLLASLLHNLLFFWKTFLNGFSRMSGQLALSVYLASCSQNQGFS